MTSFLPSVIADLTASLLGLSWPLVAECLAFLGKNFFRMPKLTSLVESAKLALLRRN